MLGSTDVTSDLQKAESLDPCVAQRMKDPGGHQVPWHPAAQASSVTRGTVTYVVLLSEPLPHTCRQECSGKNEKMPSAGMRRECAET